MVGLKGSIGEVTAAMWAVAASVWNFSADMGTITGVVWAVEAYTWDTHAAHGMLKHLCRLLRALWGLLQAQGGIGRHCVSY